jgi:hypothetical protein
VAFAGRCDIPGWGWLALAGAFNVVVGILALSWPEATVRVLCILLGAEIVVFGVLLLIWAFVQSSARTSSPAPEPDPRPGTRAAAHLDRVMARGGAAVSVPGNPSRRRRQR